jgi:DNA-binding transcriptional MerR regulator
LATSTGVSIRSLRYYEQQGLIAPQRAVNGYRDYHQLSIEQVNTIQFYLSLGLTTEQISSFLHCVLKNKEAFCKEIMPIYQQKLAEINQQLHLLAQMKSNLEERIHSIAMENSHSEAN